jgi:O-antigen ligase
MDPIAVSYLHIETILLLPFLVMLIWAQVGRTAEIVPTVKSGRRQAWILFGLFGILSAGFGQFLMTLSPLLALELAAGVTLSFLHPVNALCFFVEMLFLRPWRLLPTHTLLLALPRLLASVCLISWLMHPLRRGRIGSLNYRAISVLLAFSLWLFMSTLITPDYSLTQSMWFDTYFKCLIVFLMCSFFIENEHSLTEFKYTLLLGIFSMVFLGLYQFMSSTGETRLTALNDLDPNDLAAVSVIVVPMALSLMLGKVRTFSQRMVGAFVCTVALVSIWYAQSRGALLALLAQLIAFQLLRGVSRRRVLTVGFALGAVMLYPLIISNLSRDKGDLQESSESRKTFWIAAIRMTMHNPLLGVGYDQFPEKYESYTPSMEFWGKHAAHSSWLLAFAESGIPGGLLFVGFFLTVVITAWRHRREHPEDLFALGGYAVAMTFLTHTYFIFPYLLYGLIMASDSIKERTYHALT